MSDAFWQSFWTALPVILTLVGTGIYNIIKELKTAKAITENKQAIDKNTELAKQASDEASKAHSHAKTAQDELELNRQLISEKLEASEKRKELWEEELKKQFEQLIEENQRLKNSEIKENG